MIPSAFIDGSDIQPSQSYLSLMHLQVSKIKRVLHFNHRAYICDVYGCHNKTAIIFLYNIN